MILYQIYYYCNFYTIPIDVCTLIPIRSSYRVQNVGSPFIKSDSLLRANKLTLFKDDLSVGFEVDPESTRVGRPKRRSKRVDPKIWAQRWVDPRFDSKNEVDPRVNPVVGPIFGSWLKNLGRPWVDFNPKKYISNVEIWSDVIPAWRDMITF
jgi:hypothetical protein